MILVFWLLLASEYGECQTTLSTTTSTMPITSTTTTTTSATTLDVNATTTTTTNNDTATSTTSIMATTTLTPLNNTLVCETLTKYAVAVCSSTSTWKCSRLCDDAICALKTQFATDLCTNEYYTQASKLATRCSRAPICQKGKRTVTCTDLRSEFTCREALQTCVGDSVSTTTCSKQCMTTFLKCLNADCSPELLGSDCLNAGCKKSECADYVPVEANQFCLQFCNNTCSPTLPTSCSCEAGQYKPTNYTCSEAPPATTRTPAPPSGPLMTGNPWIDENWIAFLVIVIVGGLCLCICCCAIVGFIYKKKNSDKDTAINDDLDYYK